MTGATGSQGNNGTAGIQGSQGSQGNDGTAALTGATGIQGLQGSQGFTGPAGGGGGGSSNGTTTITMALTYTTQSTTTTPAASGVSLFTGITMLSALPSNLQIDISGNYVFVTNSKPLPTSNAIVKQKARSCLIPSVATFAVLSQVGTTSITDPDNMYYNSISVITGLGKYTYIRYNPSTIGSFHINAQFSTSNGLLGPSTNIVGTVTSADPGTEFVGIILSLTLDNSVLQ